MASHQAFSLAYKVHAVKREGERSLYVPDVLYVLKHGFVYEEPAPATRQGYFRYEMHGLTPNSGGRAVGLVVIPDVQNCVVKLVTIMWIDEKATRAGTLLEAYK